MPLARIALRSGKPPEYRRAIGEAIHQCMVAELNVPAEDRFQLVTGHEPDSWVYDRNHSAFCGRTTW